MNHSTIFLTKEEVAKLKGFCDTGTHDAKAINKARALMLMDKGEFTESHFTMADTAAATGLSEYSLRQLKTQFKKDGVEGIINPKKPKVPIRRKEQTGPKLQETLIASQMKPDGKPEWELKLMPNGRVELFYYDEPLDKKKKR